MQMCLNTGPINDRALVWYPESKHVIAKWLFRPPRKIWTESLLFRWFLSQDLYTGPKKHNSNHLNTGQLEVWYSNGFSHLNRRYSDPHFGNQGLDDEKNFPLENTSSAISQKMEITTYLINIVNVQRLEFLRFFSFASIG